ncbi:hypothetical protein ACJX0J_039923, partial [Zea mays]
MAPVEPFRRLQRRQAHRVPHVRLLPCHNRWGAEGVVPRDTTKEAKMEWLARCAHSTALGFAMPSVAHVSLILASYRNKGKVTYYLPVKRLLQFYLSFSVQ